MPKIEIINHPSYGKIEVTHNPRARHIILRARPDALHITLPPRACKSDLEKAINKFGEKLKERQDNMRSFLIDENFSIDTPLFKFHIQTHTGKAYRLLCKGNSYTLLCPEEASFKGSERQEWIKKIITDAMMREAKKALPQRLQQLATQHNLQYKKVSIRNSRTRWGSCSSSGTISLCAHLVSLPDELIDYVLLHELCHTVEMNHSPQFWSKLDTLTGTNSKSLREKLKKHKPFL